MAKMDLDKLIAQGQQSAYKSGKIDLDTLIRLSEQRVAARQGGGRKKRAKKQTIFEKHVRVYRQAPRQQAGFSTVAQLYAWGAQGERIVELFESWPKTGRVSARSAKGFGARFDAPITMFVGRYKGIKHMSDSRIVVPGWPDTVEAWINEHGVPKAGEPIPITGLPKMPKYLAKKGGWGCQWQSHNIHRVIEDVIKDGAPARIDGAIEIGDACKEALVWLTTDEYGSYPFNATWLAAVVASVGGPPVKLILAPRHTEYNKTIDKITTRVANEGSFVVAIGPDGKKAALAGIDRIRVGKKE